MKTAIFLLATFFMTLANPIEIKKTNNSVNTKKVIQCGDLLKQYAKKPDNLEFVSCNKGSGQTVFEAKYKLLGKHADSIEKFLIKEYGIGKLKFNCCIWESEKGKTGEFRKQEFLKSKGIYRAYVISMSSEETPINNRKKWNEISYFYVVAKIIDI